MIRVLLYHDLDDERIVWDISTVALRNRAYLELFELIDSYGEVQVMTAFKLASEQLCDMARRGNPDFARAFLELHRNATSGAWEELPVLPFRGSSIKKHRKIDVPEATSDAGIPPPFDK